MRDAFTKILEAAPQAEVLVDAGLISFDGEGASIDHASKRFGVQLTEDDRKITDDLSADRPFEPEADSLAIEDVSSGVYGEFAALAEAIFPVMNFKLLTGHGVAQVAQAPLVSPVLGGNAGFAGTDGGRGRPSSAGSDFVSDEESVLAGSGDDTPSPGAAALAVLGLACMRRRRA
jgi:MYXO-CTERM domain-containing protein